MTEAPRNGWSLARSASRPGRGGENCRPEGLRYNYTCFGPSCRSKRPPEQQTRLLAAFRARLARASRGRPRPASPSATAPLASTAARSAVRDDVRPPLRGSKWRHTTINQKFGKSEYLDAVRSTHPWWVLPVRATQGIVRVAGANVALTTAGDQCPS